MTNLKDTDSDFLLNTLMDHLRDPVFYFTDIQSVDFGNPAFEALLPIGKAFSWSRLLPESDLAAFEEKVAVVTSSQQAATLQVRLRQISENGPSPVRWYEFQLIPIGGGVFGVAHDVHEWIMREEQEREREQSRRREALGLLAGEVAHEFANLVGGIEGLAFYVLDTTDPSNPEYEDWVMVHRAAQRGTTLTRDLLAVAGKRLLNRENFDIILMIRTLMQDLRRQEPDVKVTLSLPERAQVEICGSEVQLHQVFRNLWTNALDAIRGTSVAQPAIHVVVDLPSEKQVVNVGVEDNGPGIPPEHLERLFEPYFTTKKERGTGLGLSVAFGVVKKHGGDLQAENLENGSGARMRVQLPLASTSAETGAGPDDQDPDPR